MDRNPYSDLEAVAAMPGLERIADALLDGYVTRRTQGEVMSYLVFLAGRHAFGSANLCDSMMLSTPMWDSLRASAERVGRILPKAPPTFDKLRHFRDKLPADAIARAAVAFSEEAVPLAKSAGLMDPTSTRPWDDPAPGNVLSADGSVFSALSGVMETEDGEVIGSRAKANPRIPKVFEGKDGKHESSGLPLALVGCHGRERWQRAVLGIDIFFDRNEVAASLQLFARVKHLAGDGATHIVYDRLLSGVHLAAIMSFGMIPVVAMKQARKDSPHVLLPEEQRNHGYASETVPERNGAKPTKGRSRKVAPKSRLAFHRLHAVEHDVHGEPCVHELWSLDGGVVTVEANTELSLDAAKVPCRDLEWGSAGGSATTTGVFIVPCEHGELETRIELSGSRPGRAYADGCLPAMADRVRPIPEASEFFARLAGLRSEVESVFSTLKAKLPNRRSGSLHPEHFVLDMIGASLGINAVLWDVHVVGHTECARTIRRKKAMRAQRA